MPLSAIPDPHGSARPPEGNLDLASRIERAQAIAPPPPRVSRRLIVTILAAFVLAGVGGGVADNYLNAHTVNPGASSAATTTLGTAPVPAHRLDAGVVALMGLSAAHGTAPSFQLTNQAGAPVRLGSLRGKVVVLTFFDPSCNDICPVLAAELRAADRDLGARAAPSVAFLSVNADPLAVGPGASRTAARASGLGGPGGLANWQYLNGSLPTLNRVWTHYGISVDVQPATGQVAHNELLWLISPTGTLAYRVTPFANESRVNGSYDLPPATEARFGAGIARYARRLLTSTGTTR